MHTAVLLKCAYDRILHYNKDILTYSYILWGIETIEPHSEGNATQAIQSAFISTVSLKCSIDAIAAEFW